MPAIFTKQLLSIYDVCEVTSLSKTTVYKLLRRGEFVRPVKISERRVGWKANEITDWVNARTGA